MTTKEERIVERIEGASGGKGILRKEVLIDKEQMGEHCGLFGEVTLEPGAVLGYHEHHGETETYYILSGNGVYVDNGEEIPAKEGDVFFCKDGDGHGLKNTGERDLVFCCTDLKKIGEKTGYACRFITRLHISGLFVLLSFPKKMS